MKLIVLRDNLKNGLSAVEKAVTESTALPILKNVLLKTFNNRIKIEATNLELGVSRFISGKIIEEGSVTIPFSVFFGIINSSNAERINLETENNNLIVKADNYEAKIQGISPEEFPIIPKINNLDYYLELEGEIFKKALLKTVPCVQLSEIRPEIGGVLFDFQLTVLKLAATDTFRLAEKSIYNNQFKTNFIRGFKAIVPVKTIQEIIRIFPDDQKITIHMDSNQVFLKNDDTELISRLIDGEYPDYEQIIPKEFESEITLSNAHFVNALKLVSNFSGRINDVKIRLKNGKKNLEVYSASQYLGENNYLIPIKAKGQDFEEVKFNWRYLLDGLKIAGSENIFFGVNGDSKPAIMKSPEDASCFYVLMPIKNT